MRAALQVLTSPRMHQDDAWAALPASTALQVANWRSSAHMREGNWCCPNCRAVVPKADRTCSKCGAAHSDMSMSASAAEVAAVAADAGSCAYGRGLKFAQRREQSLGEGVGALPSSPNYSTLVFDRTASIGHSDGLQTTLIEPRPENGVVRLDGWMALQTGESVHQRLTQCMHSPMCMH